jgi:hypothetical protein
MLVGTTLGQRLRANVEAFVDHLTENRDAYVAFIRGSAGGDPDLLAVTRTPAPPSPTGCSSASA